MDERVPQSIFASGYDQLLKVVLHFLLVAVNVSYSHEVVRISARSKLSLNYLNWFLKGERFLFPYSRTKTLWNVVQIWFYQSVIQTSNPWANSFFAQPMSCSVSSWSITGSLHISAQSRGDIVVTVLAINLSDSVFFSPRVTRTCPPPTWLSSLPCVQIWWSVTLYQPELEEGSWFVEIVALRLLQAWSQSSISGHDVLISVWLSPAEGPLMFLRGALLNVPSSSTLFIKL